MRRGAKRGVGCRRCSWEINGRQRDVLPEEATRERSHITLCADDRAYFLRAGIQVITLCEREIPDSDRYRNEEQFGNDRLGELEDQEKEENGTSD